MDKQTPMQIKAFKEKEEEPEKAYINPKYANVKSRLFEPIQQRFASLSDNEEVKNAKQKVIPLEKLKKRLT